MRDKTDVEDKTAFARCSEETDVRRHGIDLSIQQSSKKTILQVAMFGVVCLILLTHMAVVVKILLNQNAAISSVLEADHELHGRIDLLNDEVVKLSKSIYGMADSERSSKGHSQWSRTARAVKPLPEDQKKVHDTVVILQAMRKSLSQLALDMKSEFGDFQMEIESLNTSLQENRKFLQASADNDLDTTKSMIKNVNNTFHTISKNVAKSHSNLAGIVRESSPGANLTDGVEEILSLVTGVDANVTQIKRLTHSIEGHLKSLNDILVNASEATGQFDNTRYDSKMIGREQNETVQRITADLQQMKYQGMEIIERLDNISKIQLPLLSYVQTKAVSELDARFSTLQRYINASTSIDSNTDLSETFCDHKDSCVTYKLERLKHCYQISDHKVSWLDAQKKCKKMGGYLAEINSLSEQRFFKHAVQNSVSYWLGASDAHSEGNWVWQHSMQPMTLSTWNKGEPNNSGQEHCLMGFKKLQLWNDAPCNVKLGYICERDDGQCWQ